MCAMFAVDNTLGITKFVIVKVLLRLPYQMIKLISVGFIFHGVHLIHAFFVLLVGKTSVEL